MTLFKENNAADRLNSLAPELLTIIAEFIQAGGDLSDLLKLAMTNQNMRVIVAKVLARYGLWYDIGTASSTSNAWKAEHGCDNRKPLEFVFFALIFSFLTR